MHFRISALYCSASANLEFSGSLKFPNNNKSALSLDQSLQDQPMGSGDFSLKKKLIGGSQLRNYFNATIKDTQFVGYIKYLVFVKMQQVL